MAWKGRETPEGGLHLLLKEEGVILLDLDRSGFTAGGLMAKATPLFYWKRFWKQQYDLQT